MKTKILFPVMAFAALASAQLALAGDGVPGFAIGSNSPQALRILIENAPKLSFKNENDLPEEDRRLSFQGYLAQQLTSTLDRTPGAPYVLTRVISGCEPAAEPAKVQVCTVSISRALYRFNPSTREEAKLPFDEAGEGDMTNFRFQVKSTWDAASGKILRSVVGNAVRVSLAG